MTVCSIFYVDAPEAKHLIEFSLNFKKWLKLLFALHQIQASLLEDLYWTNLIISSKLASIRCRANSNFNHFLKFTPERTQSNAWLWEHQHKILNKLSRRLEHIIGLQVSNVEDIILASEAYQVQVALSWKVFFFILVLSIEFQLQMFQTLQVWLIFGLKRKPF